MWPLESAKASTVCAVCVICVVVWVVWVCVGCLGMVDVLGVGGRTPEPLPIITQPRTKAVPGRNRRTSGPVQEQPPVPDPSCHTSHPVSRMVQLGSFPLEEVSQRSKGRLRTMRPLHAMSMRPVQSNNVVPCPGFRLNNFLVLPSSLSLLPWTFVHLLCYLVCC